MTSDPTADVQTGPPFKAEVTSPGGVYNLHTLGWAYFQTLCGTILREVLGQTFQVFAETADAGRDGAFFGKWTPSRAEEMCGNFVVQCKFTAKAGAVLRVSDVSDEILKVHRLARSGLEWFGDKLSVANKRVSTCAS